MKRYEVFVHTCSFTEVDYLAEAIDYVMENGLIRERVVVWDNQYNERMSWDDIQDIAGFMEVEKKINSHDWAKEGF